MVHKLSPSCLRDPPSSAWHMRITECGTGIWLLLRQARVPPPGRATVYHTRDFAFTHACPSQSLRDKMLMSM